MRVLLLDVEEMLLLSVGSPRSIARGYISDSDNLVALPRVFAVIRSVTLFRRALSGLPLALLDRNIDAWIR